MMVRVPGRVPINLLKPHKGVSLAGAAAYARFDALPGLLGRRGDGRGLLPERDELLLQLLLRRLGELLCDDAARAAAERLLERRLQRVALHQHRLRRAWLT